MEPKNLHSFLMWRADRTMIMCRKLVTKNICGTTFAQK